MGGVGEGGYYTHSPSLTHLQSLTHSLTCIHLHSPTLTHLSRSCGISDGDKKSIESRISGSSQCFTIFQIAVIA
jgi:hypothetical protein